MKVVLREARASTGALVISLFDKGPDFGREDRIDGAHRQVVANARRAKVFRGDLGEVSVQVSAAKGRGQPLVLFGLGNAKKLDAERLRRAFGVLARCLSKLGAGRATLGLRDAAARRALGEVGQEAGVRAMTEGAILGDYQFHAKGGPRKRSAETRVCFRM